MPKYLSMTNYNAPLVNMQRLRQEANSTSEAMQLGAYDIHQSLPSLLIKLAHANPEVFGLLGLGCVVSGIFIGMRAHMSKRLVLSIGLAQSLSLTLHCVLIYMLTYRYLNEEESHELTDFKHGHLARAELDVKIILLISGVMQSAILLGTYRGSLDNELQL